MARGQSSCTLREHSCCGILKVWAVHTRADSAGKFEPDDITEEIMATVREGEQTSALDKEILLDPRIERLLREHEEDLEEQSQRALFSDKEARRARVRERRGR